MNRAQNQAALDRLDRLLERLDAGDDHVITIRCSRDFFPWLMAQPRYGVQPFGLHNGSYLGHPVCADDSQQEAWSVQLADIELSTGAPS